MEILRHKSPFQEILLETTKDGGYRLWLDNYIQFDTKYEKAYHELIADLPLTFARHTRTALIMGGGDGLAAREILKYPVRLIINVELDPAMIAIAKRPPISDLNRGSFYDRRVRVIAGDALRWVKRLPKKAFDVVIADFPAATNSEIRKLYSKGFYEDVKALMTPGAIFVTQVSEDAKDFQKIRDNLKEVFGHTRSVGIGIGAFVEKFIFASDEPIVPRRRPIAAPWAARMAERLKVASARGEARGKITVNV